MNCPRCQEATHVLSSKTKGYMVRRQRACGMVKNKQIVGKTCGLKFYTVELPVGWSCDVAIRMTPDGIDANFKRGK